MQALLFIAYVTDAVEMAYRRRSLCAKFRCDVCLKEFDYKYRYERHVENTFHKDKVRLMEICASTENLEAEWESGNVDTSVSSTVTKSHSPSATNYH